MADFRPATAGPPGPPGPPGTVLVGLLAARPPAGSVGLLYFATDASNGDGALFVDTGAAWRACRVDTDWATWGVLSVDKVVPNAERFAWHGGSVLTAASLTDTAGAFPVLRPGVLRRWAVRHQTPAPHPIIWRLYRNGAPTGVTATVPAMGTNALALGAVALSVGDYITSTVQCAAGPLAVHVVRGVAAAEVAFNAESL